MKLIINCLLRKLHLQAVNYRNRLYPANPYLQHLELLIKYCLVPFTSVDHLLDHRVDSKMVTKEYLLISVLFLNLFRLTALVVHPTPSVREAFVQYFSGQANSWNFHFSLMVGFVVVPFLCK